MQKAKEPKPTFQKYVAYWNKDGGEIVNEVVAAQCCEEDRLWPICITHVPTGSTDGCKSLWDEREPVADRIIAQADTFLGIVVRIQQLCNQRKATPEAPTRIATRPVPRDPAGTSQGPANTLRGTGLN